MTVDRLNQRNSVRTPVFTIVNPAAAEITACRLRQFLDEAIGTDRGRSAFGAWVEVLRSSTARITAAASWANTGGSVAAPRLAHSGKKANSSAAPLIRRHALRPC